MKITISWPFKRRNQLQEISTGDADHRRQLLEDIRNGKMGKPVPEASVIAGKRDAKKREEELKTNRSNQPEYY